MASYWQGRGGPDLFSIAYHAVFTDYTLLRIFPGRGLSTPLHIPSAWSKNGYSLEECQWVGERVI
jgi:hypothetical protein